MSKWTTANIPDLRGKTALITGANSGLGLETARAMAAKGAQIVLACRGADKAQAAMAQIKAETPAAQLDFLPVDLSSLASVRTAAEQARSRWPRLDVLVNNAGIMGVPYGKTADGFERHFGTNFLGHFLFTGLLIDHVGKIPGARVVSLSSIMHKRGSLKSLDDPNWEKGGYSVPGAYAWSKLTCLMFALELERRLRKGKADTISVAAHPGYSATNIVFGDTVARNSFKGWIMATGNSLLAQSAAQGALPSLYAATSAEVRGGEYYGPGGFMEMTGYPVRAKPTAAAADAAGAARLWEISEKLTGFRYP